MAAALVAHSYFQSTGTGTLATGINTTGANLLVVSVHCESSSFTISDTQSSSHNTYLQIGSTLGPSGYYNKIFYCLSPAYVGTSHTWTITGSSVYAFVAIQAFSGISALDQNSGSSYTNLSSVQPGSITPTYTNELVITSIGFDGGPSSSASINLGFTITDQHTSTASAGGGMAYLIASAASAINPVWTINSTSNGGCPMVSFKANNSLLPVTNQGNFLLFF